MNVMLLSAGEGVRLRPYTLQAPKPAIPFLGVPLAAYSLSLLEEIKIHNLVVNTYHLPDQIEALFRNLKAPCDKLSFSSEAGGLLGSGGGIHKAKPLLEGRDHFLVMNADEVILPHENGMMTEFITIHKKMGGIATLLTMEHPGVGKQFGGAWTLPNSGHDDIFAAKKVSLFSKTSPGSEFVGHHFIGAMLFSDRIFHYFKDQVEVENILYETLTKAMAAGESVYTHDISCEWFETGNPKDFLAATDQILKSLTAGNDTWLMNLKQTIREHGTGQLMLEKEEPRIASALESQFKEIHGL